MSETRIMRRSMSDRHQGKTDWSKLEAQTDEQIDQHVADDPDAAPDVTAEWLARADVLAPTKRAISIRLDLDILDYFQKTGPRYQSQINQVLRAYMEAKAGK